MAVFLFEDKYLTEDELFEEFDEILKENVAQGIARVIGGILKFLPSIRSPEAARVFAQKWDNYKTKIWNSLILFAINDPEAWRKFAWSYHKAVEKYQRGNQEEFERIQEAQEKLIKMYDESLSNMDQYTSWTNKVGAGGKNLLGLQFFLRRKGLDPAKIGSLPFTKAGSGDAKLPWGRFKELWDSRSSVGKEMQGDGDSAVTALSDEQIKFIFMANVTRLVNSNIVNVVNALIPQKRVNTDDAASPDPLDNNPNEQPQAANDDAPRQDLAASKQVSFEEITRKILG